MKYTKKPCIGLNSVCRFAILFLNLTTSTVKATAESHGLGARKIDIFEAPHLVQFTTVERDFYCAGTLVSDRHVVTAAHCLEKVSIFDIKIVANATDLRSGGVMRKVVRVDIHTKYDPVTRDRDVAVLKVDKPFKFGKTLKKVGLCKGTFKDGDELEVSGWGDTKRKQGELISMTVNAVTHESCKGNVSLTRTMACAVNAPLDICKTDSGTPVIVNNRLCGVVLYGNECGLPSQVIVYTNISTVRRFIRESIQQ